MKRLFTIFFALLLGITAAFAQTQPTLPYQAVVRDNQNHLLKDADVSIDVQIYEGATLRYSETQTPHSNANGLISFNIGAGSGATGTMADVADWRVAKFKFTYHLTDGDVVVTDSVHAVPYALQTAFAIGGNFLTSDSAVITTMQGNITTNTTDIAANTTDIAALANRVNTFNTNVCDSVATCVGNAIDARGFLTSDSAVITTMQGNIATNTTDIATNTADIAALANRVNTFNTNVCDSVKDCDFSGNASIQNMLQELSDLISAQNHKIDSLGHIVDSLSNLPPGGGDEPTTFTCGTSTVKDIENNEYNTVQIGDQCWMKENLRTTKNPNGENITEGMWEPGTNSVETYGRLYSWTTVMNGATSSEANPSGVQGICPDGWHVPSDAEWTQMEMAVGMSEGDANNTGYRGNIAAKLCGNTGWTSSSTDNAAGNTSAPNRNSSGFSALPAGFYSSSYNDFGYGAFFWSATESSIAYAYYHNLGYHSAGVYRGNANKANGNSVRCVRDAETGSDTPGGGEPTIVDTVTCYPNLGSNVPEKKTVTRGENLDLSTTFTHPAETNWEIAGWNTSADGTGTSYTNTITTSGNLTLYAQWHTFCTGTPNTSVNEFGSNRIDSLQDADNNKYTVVQIGNQCWMKENLRTTKKPNNENITEGMWEPGSNSVETYGRLYDWTTMMNGDSSSVANPSGVQGICPTGWHVPSDAEWKQMEMAVGMSESDANGTLFRGSIAAKLSGNTGWNSSTNEDAAGNTYATDRNATGFSALPAGYYRIDGYYFFGQGAYFWSATEKGSDDEAYGRSLQFSKAGVSRAGNEYIHGYSVRCVRD